MCLVKYVKKVQKILDVHVYIMTWYMQKSFQLIFVTQGH